MTNTQERFLTTAEVAAELRVNPETVRRWINAGKLPAVRLGPTNYRVERKDFDALVAQLRTTTPLVVPVPR
ncbi:helix-turn-helix domain-containing protein [Pimelobacter simplex]|uniref:helix-turn-helix domain-containing protein n=1 Tax=Nocardioides simplex TaxID=2045 RepID=UPI00214FBF7F|nr:helix-turn-helix domain-containing protein [Pimelobacter simplex]UUW92683.1 helix-turn-helix domain-containing protein [Pimelobacter simplex]UUW96511.1 helix-turn-helix domain-containing protein [Pimelobacter simplex]